MFLVNVSFIKNSVDGETNLRGYCPALPVNDYEFSIEVPKDKHKVLIAFGKVLEQREDFGIITFRTRSGVFELKILDKLNGGRGSPPNVVDFLCFKKKKEAHAKGALVLGGTGKAPSKSQIDQLLGLLKGLNRENRVYSVMSIVNKSNKLQGLSKGSLGFTEESR